MNENQGKVKEIKNTKNQIRLPLFIGAAMALGIFIGAQMANSGGEKPELFKSIYKLRQVISYIEKDYVDEVDTEKLVDGMIEDMLVKLDPHSVYISKEELELSQSELRGNFEGIGIQFSIIKDTINVIAALSGGPSEKLGIRSGDRIVKVNGENVAGVGITTRDVMSKLMGPKGTEVNVTILRKSGDNLSVEYTIERDVIPVSSVDVAYMIDEEIGYIKLSRFTATSYMEFKEALTVLQGKGLQKLVLDLTNNPGGIMSVAVDMVDEFLAGKQLIVYTQGKESRYNENHISKIKGDFEENPVIVLINEGSASASEIVAGALQDHDRGLIVGRRSFGKGLVQVGMGLNDGSQLRLTISIQQFRK
ncbi:MAG: S41 family peptidase [Proteobacteria bacterium]|nr:S41 family peptidase [Pseudomonadota bacterium]